MVIKVNSIDEIDYSLYGEHIIKNISEVTLGNFNKNNIPLKFQYNSNWSVKHTCSCCKKVISFGEGNSSVHVKYFKTKYLCSKYYTEDFLKFFPDLFKDSSLKYFEDEIYVICNGVFQENYPVTSSLLVMYYECLECNSTYLCRINQVYPIEPERNNPYGSPGIIVIDEIIQIEVVGGKTFSDLQNFHRQ